MQLKSTTPATCTSISENQNQILESDECGYPEVLLKFYDDMCDEGLANNIVIEKCDEKQEMKLVWRNIIAFSIIHLAALYGGWLMFTSGKWITLILAGPFSLLTGFGITGGAHRLWTHRAYKAKWQLKLILTILNTIAFQNSIYNWARDHRVHHKYSETNADPHNATRGFFFSHVGWLLCKKHPDVKEKGKSIDLSDLQADPFVMFQKRFYVPLMLLGCFVIPTLIPMYFWNETFVNSFFIWVMYRWCFVLNATWSVNSAAHAFGYKPYDKSINPVENIGVAFFALGEGWHNYHHVFPWDYRTSEWGGSILNVSTTLINWFAKIGWAYDLKTVSKEVIERRVQRTGDGSHGTWGWGDKDLTKGDTEGVLIMSKRIK